MPTFGATRVRPAIRARRRDLCCCGRIAHTVARLQQLPHGEPDLSPREVQVLRLIASGRTAAQAAKVLVLSESTVKSYIQNLLHVLGAANRGHAVLLGLAYGLVTNEHVCAGRREKAPPGPHTRREWEVLGCLARGLTYREIARELHIALHTTKTHVRRVIAAMREDSRVQAVAYAAVDGLFDPAVLLAGHRLGQRGRRRVSPPRDRLGRFAQGQRSRAGTK
ncbi:response regulator transcription factor [Kitasatospora sp. NPDC096147]|uniref:response regulator transcription factor n=1 Tax=Kitasatospora sp. NPDC096147 TaxID=3364093 RepID=UPI003829B0CF